MDDIRRGDYGITINVVHTSSDTVKYSLNGGPEINLIDNDHLVLSASQTSRVGINTITYVEVTGDSRLTSPDLYEFNVY